MSKTPKKILTDDEALVKMSIALVERARAMGHGTMRFTGCVDVHDGRIRQISITEKTESLTFRAVNRPDD